MKLYCERGLQRSDRKEERRSRGEVKGSRLTGKHGDKQDKIKKIYSNHCQLCIPKKYKRTSSTIKY